MASLRRLPTASVRGGGGGDLKFSEDRHPGYKKCSGRDPPTPPLADVPAYRRMTLRHCIWGRTPAWRKRRTTVSDGYYVMGETRNFRGIDSPVIKSALVRRRHVEVAIPAEIPNIFLSCGYNLIWCSNPEEYRAQLAQSPSFRHRRQTIRQLV